MKTTRQIMGMPITIWLPFNESSEVLHAAFDFFGHVDEVFSTYKKSSEISRLNRGELKEGSLSKEVRDVLKLCGDFKEQTLGYFDITKPDGSIDPSGLVKGWSIQKAAQILDSYNIKSYAIDAGGDMVIRGPGPDGPKWSVGIRLPIDKSQTAKGLNVTDCAVATSGAYERGAHIYSPKTGRPITEILSVSVVGPDIVTADVLATALFAMGKGYPKYLKQILPAGYEIYVIDDSQTASFTAGFEKFTVA